MILSIRDNSWGTVGKTISYDTSGQCDQMVDCLFNFWPMTAMKICPIAYKINQINLKILPNIK